MRDALTLHYSAHLAFKGLFGSTLLHQKQLHTTKKIHSKMLHSNKNSSTSPFFVELLNRCSTNFWSWWSWVKLPTTGTHYTNKFQSCSILGQHTHSSCQRLHATARAQGPSRHCWPGCRRHRCPPGPLPLLPSEVCQSTFTVSSNSWFSYPLLFFLRLDGV